VDKRELHMYKLEEAVTALLAGTPVKRIARVQKISKNTVKKYRKQLEHILSENPDLAENVVDLMNEFCRFRATERYSTNYGWLEDNSKMIEDLTGNCENYVRLFQVLQEKGFQGSYSSLQRYAAKSITQKDGPVFRIETKAGEIAQVDFGSIGKIYDELTQTMVKAYVFVMVLGYSRDAYYEIVKSQDINTWCSCHVHAFEHFGGVPHIIIPDNLKSAIIKAAYMDPIANRSYADCAQHYGFQIDPCLPGTPEHKGKVESGVKYVKRNFLPLREFKNIADANKQLQEWNEETARKRIHGTTRRMPQELFEQHEKQALHPLTSERFEISVWKTLKVYRDIHIQCDKAYYSVPHQLRGEYVEVRKTASQVAVFHQNELVATHIPAKIGARRTNMDHYPPDSGRYMRQDTDYCLHTAQQIGAAVYTVVHTLLRKEAIRNLRSAQNIIRLKNKYGSSRLEAACARSSSYGNYTYRSIKQILETGMDTQMNLFSVDDKKLSDAYARDIHELLQ
jgi:transposase